MRTSVWFALAMIGCGSSSSTPPAGPDAAPPPPPPTQTANGVFPAQAFAGRDVRIEISGDNTTWSSSTTVSLGPDVTVNSVSVAGPTDLFADVTISATATPGLVDVTVTDGSAMFKLTQAFEIDVPIGATFQGAVAQGSISVFTIDNKDVANPFDATTATDANGNTVFPNITLAGPAGMNLLVENVTPFQITGVALTDVDAAASGDITVASGPSGAAVTSDAGATTVTARTAIALTAGTATTGNVTDAFDSQLYTYTPTTSVPDVQALTLATAAAGAAPAVAVLPASGHFADLISFGPASDALNTTAGTAQFFIYWDNSGTSAYSYKITETDVTLTHTATLAASSNSDLSATSETLPFLGNGGDVNTQTGQQWIKLTVAAGDVGKSLRVITLGDATTDLQIDVYTSLANAQQGTSFVECGDQGGNPVDCTSPAITATGTYFIELQPDPAFGSPTTDYVLATFFQ